MSNEVVSSGNAHADDHDLEQAGDKEQTPVSILDIITTRIKQALNVDVCSIYLIDNKTNELVLKASDGLEAESVGRVRLRFNKGIVGLVAENCKTINLANAHNHPRYHYFSETGEEIYHGFLGVPVLFDSIVVGVLVLQKARSERFNKNAVELIEHIASQLGGVLYNLNDMEITLNHESESVGVIKNSIEYLSLEALF